MQFTQIRSAVRHCLRFLGQRHWLQKLIGAFLSLCAVEIIFTPYRFDSFDYFNALSLPLHLLFLLLLWGILLWLNRPILDRTVIVSAALVYATAAAALGADLYFAMGCCLLAAAAALYSINVSNPWQLRPKTAVLFLVPLALGFVYFAGVLPAVRYLSHASSCYDFGIFTQMFDNMRESLVPVTTCERDRLLNHFAVHFSPIFYLLLPLYALFPSPVTLLMEQALILVSGLIPLYLLCRDKELSPGACLALGALYMLLPSMAGGTFYFLHENKFLTPLLLWLMYLMEKSRIRILPVLVVTLLICFVKEDAPVYVAVLGLYYLFSSTKKRQGLYLVIFALAYFILVTQLMRLFGQGIMSSRYKNYLYDGGDSLFTVIKAVILNPIYVIFTSFTAEKLLFLMQMLLPLGFLPCVLRRPAQGLLLIPLVLFNLMSDYPYQHDINYQYTYGPAAFLLLLTVLNYSQLSELIRRRMLIVALVCSVVLFATIHGPKLDYVHQYQANISTHQTIDQTLDAIPKEASVKAATFFVPSLYQHDELYQLETSKQPAEYIVLDLRYGQNLKDYVQDVSLYEELIRHPGIIALYRQR
jgi:uncharacterized membrane protein